jgi:hypothetical protein
MCKYKTLIAMMCVTAIELFAIYSGINGTALSLSFACLGGLGGYEINKRTGV